jgi:hypothetical protein
MCRIVWVPAALDKFVLGLQPPLHGDHVPSCRLLGLAMAFAWGRRNVANLYQSREPAHHRTRVNHCCLVPRGDPEAALRQQARELRQTLPPQPRETRDLSIDASQQAQRGQARDAVTQMQDPALDAYLRGHQYGCGLLVLRQPVLPQGIRLDVK